MVQGKIPPHLAEVRIPSALPKQCVRVCSVDCYRQIKKKKHWISSHSFKWKFSIGLISMKLQHKQKKKKKIQ